MVSDWTYDGDQWPLSVSGARWQVSGLRRWDSGEDGAGDNRLQAQAPEPECRVSSARDPTSASVTFSIPALINFECFESKPNFLINIETRSEVKINFPDYSLQRSYFFSGFDGSFEVGRPTQRVFYGSLKIASLIGDGQKKFVNNHYVRFCTVYVFSIIKLLVLAWSSSSLSDITFPAHGCSQWTRRQLISKGSPLLPLLFSERRV